MTGIDLQKNLNFMLYDMKGNSSFPNEIASVRIELNEIEVTKIHHMQPVRINISNSHCT